MLVVALAAYDHEPFMTLEPMGAVGRVGDENEEDDGPRGAEGTDDEELVLPGPESGISTLR